MAHELFSAGAVQQIAESPVFAQLQPSYLRLQGASTLPTSATILLRYMHAILSVLLYIKHELGSSQHVNAALAAFFEGSQGILVATLKLAMEGLAADGYLLTSTRLAALREEVDGNIWRVHVATVIAQLVGLVTPMLRGATTSNPVPETQVVAATRLEEHVVMLAAAAAAPRSSTFGEDADLAAGPPAALRAGLATRLAEFDKARACLASAVTGVLHVGWCGMEDMWDTGRVQIVGIDTERRFGGLQVAPTLGLASKLVRVSRL